MAEDSNRGEPVAARVKACDADWVQDNDLDWQDPLVTSFQRHVRAAINQT